MMSIMPKKSTDPKQKYSPNWGGKRPGLGAPKKDPALVKRATGLRFTKAGNDALKAIQREFPGHSLNNLGEYCVMDALTRVKSGELRF